MDRLLGLDALRFFAALWVVMRHGAMPPLTTGAGKEDLAQTVAKVWNGSISGPAAVIVFFVISGFCIHLPYARGKTFDLGEYVLRRFVRVVLPMAAALLLWRLFHGWDDFPSDWLGGIPAWSIVAELIYYALYPVLRLVPRTPWKGLVGATFVGGLAFAWFTQTRTNINYPAWGYHLDWLLGLPVWLLGVVLAHGKPTLPSPSVPRIWIARLFAVALGSLTTWLAWQRHAGHHLTLNFVGLYAVWWIRQELGYYRSRKPPAIFEWAGTWSYSIYLVHGPAFAVYKQIRPAYFGHLADWILKLAFVLVLSWIFHMAVEKPSHRLAQFLARRWTARRSDRRSTLETKGSHVDLEGVSQCPSA